MPKFNMYQSLHTTVIGPGGKPVELQIRTCDMHRRAEYGVAAHWKYKEETVFGRSRRQGRHRRKWPGCGSWSTGSARPRTRPSSSTSLRFDLAAAEVYVFTPRGDVMALPQGSTPVDFAYAIHTEVGHRTHRRAGQRPAGGAGVRPGQRRHRGDLHLQGAEAPGPAGTGSSSCRAPGPATRSGSGSPRSAGKPRSRQGKDQIARAMRKQGLPLQRLAAADSAAQPGPRPALRRRLRAVRGGRRGPGQRPVRGREAGQVGRRAGGRRRRT